MRSLTTLLLLAAAAAAQIKTETVVYKDGNTVLEGFLAYNPRFSSLRPGILVVHQWMGLGDFEMGKAKELAELGYVAFAVDIYGKGVRPKDRGEAGALAGKYRGNPALYRSRVAAAHKALIARVFVDKKRVGAIGFCFGGTGVLELARSGADVKGVVSFHGGLATKNPADAKNIKGKVLVLHGGDDPLVPDKEVAAFMQEMRGAKVDWRFVAYGGAVHAFTDPKANVAVARYHPEAARRSWQEMREFFNEIFR